MRTDVIEYVPIKSPRKPFKFNGMFFHRDEMDARGLTLNCRVAILKYSNPDFKPRPEIVKQMFYNIHH